MSIYLLYRHAGYLSRYNEIKFCTKYPVEFRWIYTNQCCGLWDIVLLIGGILAMLCGLQ